MPIILPLGLTSGEIRVLQEFRRLNSDTLPLEKINAIKHPAGPTGEAPAVALVGKGFLTASAEGYAVTEKAKELLAIDPKPMVEVGAGGGDDEVADVE
jgi:hypothetical protein